MQSSFWRRSYGPAFCLTLAAAAVVLADAPPSDSPTTADPAGTTLYMGQLRKLFDKWDLNSDNFLDKEELAKGFRGPNAKPYEKELSKEASPDSAKDEATAKKPDGKKYPDHDFLVQLDQDNDGKISREEFMTWAKDYAVQLKEHAAQEKKLLTLETRLQGASGKEVKTVERELKREQTKIDKMNSKMNAGEKALLLQFKHK